MENIIYLLNMRICGIKNIKQEIRIDFYKKTVDKNFDPDKYRIKAIYGENGSGKSAIITAVKIFQELILGDNYLNESKTQGFLNEIIHKETCCFHFGCEFLVDTAGCKEIYDYTIHLSKNEKGLYEIQFEKLCWKNGNYANQNYKTIFECKNGELLYINCSDAQKEILKKRSMNLLSTHSLIYLYSIIRGKLTYDPQESAADRQLLVHILICLTLVIVTTVFLGDEDQHELYFLRKKLIGHSLDKQSLQNRLLDYGDLANAFSSVNERFVDKDRFENYKSKVARLTKFLKIFKTDLVSIDIDAKERGNQYECDLNLNYGEYSINREFESTGIKKLIRLFDCFVSASTNGIVFVDEMDSNLNDVYLCRLIEYFMYYGKGQLCFTTHNLDPMTILRENKNSIDFLSSDNHLVSWTSRGNASPESYYKNGMIQDLPFNIDATDFVGILGE